MLVFTERADQDMAYMNRIKKAAGTLKKVRGMTPEMMYRMLKKDYPDVDDKWLRNLAKFNESVDDKALNESSNDFRWASKNVKDFVDTLSRNNYTPESISKESIMDLYSGLCSGCKDSLEDLKNIIRLERNKGTRSDYDNNFDSFMTDLEKIFSNTGVLLTRLSKKHHIK